MKIPHILVLIFSLIQSALSNDSVSPLMTTKESQGGMKGVWIPNSYGGITGVILDLNKVGTNEMLRTKWQDDDNLVRNLGESYKLHSDKTVEDEKNGIKIRTVILISSENLEEHGYNNIICYKIHHQEARKSDEGIPLTSKSTSHSITLSAIKDDYEVLYLIPFRAAQTDLKLSKENNRKQNNL